MKAERVESVAVFLLAENVIVTFGVTLGDDALYVNAWRAMPGCQRLSSACHEAPRSVCCQIQLASDVPQSSPRY